LGNINNISHIIEIVSNKFFTIRILQRNLLA